MSNWEVEGRGWILPITWLSARSCPLTILWVLEACIIDISLMIRDYISLVIIIDIYRGPAALFGYVDPRSEYHCSLSLPLFVLKDPKPYGHPHKDVDSVGIFPCFQEEMIVQEDAIKLEKTKIWSRWNRSHRARSVDYNSSQSTTKSTGKIQRRKMFTVIDL